ncbi:GNAT family N-acetyltransferase [Staphylococcus haemolyticus]|uniref:GNAT family N-acetyltransferase n=1 Tax=Staphylococcus TaxID=1279 RepID=UPI000D1D98A4|nr:MULTISPECIES: GNAT family N-acetyltransferase [Staphylococcus]PTK77287.1 N-acetyltransferase [Staphylococcus haemolyticus]PTK85579.1 N-acetyltransferase [Staphylococcus haemolyticus]PTK97014.1 N-acetyltransferase [Staphylococcus haemolyticus]RIO62701.1 GNAT family N-acetyltransferase [Staphylococcus haemolyticus]RIO68600.1 GNAT family N-acetyltransferase [Staphylococcus haemolyticus]
MRKLTVKDMEWIESIAKIQEHYIEKREIHYNATHLSIGLRQDMIIQRLKHSNDIILIELSEDTRRLISFIWGHFEAVQEKVITEMIYTDLHFRGLGHAKRLKIALENWAIEMGAKSIEGMVDATNDAMIEFNKANGYAISHVKMRKDLR